MNVGKAASIDIDQLSQILLNESSDAPFTVFIKVYLSYPIARPTFDLLVCCI